MKKAKLFVTLLLSALMVFGVFGLTSFAADEEAATDSHNWSTWQASSDTKAIGFVCQNDDKHKCEYAYPGSENNFKLTLEASNEVFTGDSYDGYLAVSAGMFGKDTVVEIPDDFSFGDPQYKKTSDTEWSTTAPKEVGTYQVRRELIISGKSLSPAQYVYAEFGIYKPVVNIYGLNDNGELTYGIAVKPDVEFYANDIKADDTVGKELKEGVTYQYKSLDVKSSKFTKAMPKNVGHYRVRATFYNGATATKDFTIVKSTDEMIEAVGIATVDPGKSVSAIKNYDYSNLENKSAKEAVIYMMADLIDNKAIEFAFSLDGVADVNYGERLFPLIRINGTFVSPAYYTPVYTYTAKDSTKKHAFVPGVTVLKQGEYTLNFSVPATHNHVAARGLITLNVAASDFVTVTKRPAKVENLVVDDSYYQKLIVPGAAKGGHYEYALKSGDADPADTDYSKDIPRALEAGTYEVYYKLVADDNYTIPETGLKETDKAGIIEVTIAAVEKEDDPETVLVPNVKNVKVTSGKKSFTVSWSEFSEANLDKIDKIEIKYSRNEGFTKGVKTKQVSKNKTSFKVKGLKKNAKYYVKVRAIKYGAEDEDGNTILKAVSKEWTAITPKLVKTK